MHFNLLDKDEARNFSSKGFDVSRASPVSFHTFLIFGKESEIFVTRGVWTPLDPSLATHLATERIIFVKKILICKNLCQLICTTTFHNLPNEAITCRLMISSSIDFIDIKQSRLNWRLLLEFEQQSSLFKSQ